jgi:hypothetical protein
MAGEFLSGFSKFFTNLTPAQRQELDRAFADIQNSKEMTSLDTSLQNLRRKPDQLLPVPQLTTLATTRGATIAWAALPDQRINFYEIDVSTFSNFASKTLVTTFGLDIVLDGLLVSKYVRVRGVRRDGTTTPYSETAVVTPESFSIKSRVIESFYVNLTGTATNSVLGGAGTVLEYMPINPDSNSMVWGFLTAYGDPGVAMKGDSEIVVSVFVTKKAHNGNLLSVEEMWRVTLGEYWNSLNIGPFVLGHPPLGGTVTIEVTAIDGTTDQQGDPRTVGDNTTIEWCHLNVLEVGSS